MEKNNKKRSTRAFSVKGGPRLANRSQWATRDLAQHEGCTAKDSAVLEKLRTAVRDVLNFPKAGIASITNIVGCHLRLPQRAEPVLVRHPCLRQTKSVTHSTEKSPSTHYGTVCKQPPGPQCPPRTALRPDQRVAQKHAVLGIDIMNSPAFGYVVDNAMADSKRGERLLQHYCHPPEGPLWASKAHKPKFGSCELTNTCLPNRGVLTFTPTELFFQIT